MKKTVRATDFLQNMAQTEQLDAPVAVVSEKAAQVKAGRPAKTRAGLKHIGGYLRRTPWKKLPFFALGSVSIILS